MWRILLFVGLAIIYGCDNSRNDDTHTDNHSNINRNTLVYVFHERDYFPNIVSVSTGGKYLAIAPWGKWRMKGSFIGPGDKVPKSDSDYSIRLVDISNNTKINLAGQTSYVCDMFLSPDNAIFSIGRDGSIIGWDCSGNLLHKFMGGVSNEPIKDERRIWSSMFLSRTNNMLHYRYMDNICTYDINHQSICRNDSYPRLLDFKLSSNEERTVVCTVSHTYLYDNCSSRVLYDQKYGDSIPTNCWISPDGQIVLFSGVNHSIFAIDFDSGRLLWKYLYNDFSLSAWSITNIAAPIDGSFVAFGLSPGQIYLINPRSGKQIGCIDPTIRGAKNIIWHLDVSNCGNYLAAIVNESVGVWNIEYTSKTASDNHNTLDYYPVGRKPRAGIATTPTTPPETAPP